MAIVRYHSVGASNTGKVRPAPYKYANPTDLTIAPSVPLLMTSGKYDDFFFGLKRPGKGSVEQLDDFGRSRKQRREYFDQRANYYQRCTQEGAIFDPTFVDDLPLFTLEETTDGFGYSSVVTYNFSSSQYADKSAVWCKKPYWMFEVIAHNPNKEGGPPEGWYDFRFEGSQDPSFGVDPVEGVDGIAAAEKDLRKDILNEYGLKAGHKNPEQVFKRINSLRGELSDEEVNNILLNAKTFPRFDLPYAEFAKFLLPQTGITKYIEKYSGKSLSEIYIPTFKEYQQQIRDYVGEARTPDGPSKVACFLDYDIAGAAFPPLDTSFLVEKEEVIDGKTSIVYETENFDNDVDNEVLPVQDKLNSIELGPNLWPPRDDVNADVDDKWPMRGLNEQRFQFKMVADKNPEDPDSSVVSELVWEPLNPNFKRFEEGLQDRILIGASVDLAAAKIKKKDFDEDWIESHQIVKPIDPDSDSLNDKGILKSFKLPIQGKAKGKNKIKIPAMAYQMDAIAFDSSRLENLSKADSLGVNQGTSFDKSLEFIFSGPDVFGVPTTKPWQDSVDSLAHELGFEWDATDGQTWNDVTFMSGVPYVEFVDIDPNLDITVGQVNDLVKDATTAESFIDGSVKNESSEAGLNRLDFASKVLAKDDVLLSYINYGQKDSMDAGDPPGGHDGRGDPTTFNGYGLLNGFGGDDKLYSLFSSNLSYGGDGDDELTGLDKFYDRLFGERGTDTMYGMGQDVLDGGSGNDEYYVGLEPRLLIPTPKMDSSNLATLGTETDPAEEMSNFVAVEYFDIPGLMHDHKDLIERDNEKVERKAQSDEKTDYADTLYIDKNHLMYRYALKAGLDPTDMQAVEEHFYSQPRMAFTMDTIDYLGEEESISTGELNPGIDEAFQASKSAYSGAFYLWLGKEDFKGRDGGADPLIERYLSLDLTWQFNDEDDARSFRESESIARFSNLRPEELSDINDLWDRDWDDVYSQFGKTNKMHRQLIAQSIAEDNPEYKPFQPYLNELYDNVYPRWRGDGCDIVNWDPAKGDNGWDQDYEVIRKYFPGRTPVLPVEGNGKLNLTELEKEVTKFAWDLWDARREEVMDRIELRTDSPIPVLSEIVGF